MDDALREQARSRIRHITHQGKRILLVDSSHCDAVEVTAIAALVPEYVTTEPPGSVLLLADFSHATVTKEAAERIKISAVFDRPHLQRSAWVIKEGMSKVLVESIRSFSSRDIPTFETREAALDYLVK